MQNLPAGQFFQSNRTMNIEITDFVLYRKNDIENPFVKRQTIYKIQQAKMMLFYISWYPIIDFIRV